VLPHDFKIIIFFDDFCDICKSESTEIENLCLTCKEQLGEGEIKDWL
jgi:hypothetical protein